MIAGKPKTSAWMSSLGMYSVDGGRRKIGKDRVLITNPLFRVLALGRLVSCGRSNFLPAVRADTPFPDELVCGNVSQKGKVCHVKLDEQLVHSTSGCHFVRYKAHQVAVQALEFVARDLGYSVSHACGIPGMKKHADLLIYGLLDDYSATAIDLSVRTPFAQGASRLLPGTNTPDIEHHLKRAETSKCNKYDKPYAEMGRGFKPFVVSSMGMFGTGGAKEIVKALAKRYALQYYVSEQTARRRVSEFIGCSILRQVAQNSLGAQAKVCAKVGVQMPTFA